MYTKDVNKLQSELKYKLHYYRKIYRWITNEGSVNTITEQGLTKKFLNHVSEVNFTTTPHILYYY